MSYYNLSSIDGCVSEFVRKRYDELNTNTIIELKRVQDENSLLKSSIYDLIRRVRLLELRTNPEEENDI